MEALRMAKKSIIRLLHLFISLLLSSSLCVIAMEDPKISTAAASIDAIELIAAKEELEKNPRALFHSCKIGDYKKAQLLIAAGADVNKKEIHGTTPLHKAALSCHATIVRLLIANGAEVDAKASYPLQTPLHWAARNGHSDIVKMLIESGADVNAKTKNGETPLHLAAHYANAQTVKALLKNILAVKRLPSDKVESLRNICVYKLLDDNVCDANSIAANAIPVLKDLKINFDKLISVKTYEQVLLNSIASSHQNEIVERNILQEVGQQANDYFRWYMQRIKNALLDTSQNEIIEPNAPAIRQKISDYCGKYLQHIKDVIRRENLLNYAQVNHKNGSLIASLLLEITLAKTFDKLPEDMQDIMYDPELLKKEIENKHLLAKAYENETVDEAIRRLLYIVPANTSDDGPEEIARYYF